MCQKKEGPKSGKVTPKIRSFRVDFLDPGMPGEDKYQRLDNPKPRPILSRRRWAKVSPANYRYRCSCRSYIQMECYFLLFMRHGRDASPDPPPLCVTALCVTGRLKRVVLEPRNSQSSSVSKFNKNCKSLRYRHSGGRTELSEHQNTGNFMENPNLILPGLGLVIFDEFRVGAQIRFKNPGSLEGGRSPP